MNQMYPRGRERLATAANWISGNIQCALVVIGRAEFDPAHQTGADIFGANPSLAFPAGVFLGGKAASNAAATPGWLDANDVQFTGLGGLATLPIRCVLLLEGATFGAANLLAYFDEERSGVPINIAMPGDGVVNIAWATLANGGIMQL